MNERLYILVCRKRKQTLFPFSIRYFLKPTKYKIYNYSYWIFRIWFCLLIFLNIDCTSQYWNQLLKMPFCLHRTELLLTKFSMFLLWLFLFHIKSIWPKNPLSLLSPICQYHSNCNINNNEDNFINFNWITFLLQKMILSEFEMNYYYAPMYSD